jgi:hypothetical protein
MFVGGSLAEAAAFVGAGHRYLKASPGSAALAGDPAQFRLVVHALACRRNPRYPRPAAVLQPANPAGTFSGTVSRLGRMDRKCRICYVQLMSGLSLTDHISSLDVADFLASLLKASPRPLTWQLQQLTGRKLHIDVTGSGQRPLERSEAGWLDVPGEPSDPATFIIRRCCWRTGRLTDDDGLVVAGTFLLWLEPRLCHDACRDLRAGQEPAGVILGRLDPPARRESRRALPSSVIDEITGMDAAVSSKAVLMTGTAKIGLAEEFITQAFTDTLRTQEGPSGSSSPALSWLSPRCGTGWPQPGQQPRPQQSPALTPPADPQRARQDDRGGRADGGPAVRGLPRALAPPGRRCAVAPGRCALKESASCPGPAAVWRTCQLSQG